MVTRDTESKLLCEFLCWLSHQLISSLKIANLLVLQAQTIKKDSLLIYQHNQLVLPVVITLKEEDRLPEALFVFPCASYFHCQPHAIDFVHINWLPNMNRNWRFFQQFNNLLIKIKAFPHTFRITSIRIFSNQKMKSILNNISIAYTLQNAV